MGPRMSPSLRAGFLVLSRGLPTRMASGFASKTPAVCVIVNPPALFNPVTFQSPRTHTSPKPLLDPNATGEEMLTSSPHRDSQKSKPYFVGESVALVVEIKDWPPGTLKIFPLSSAEN